MRFHSWRNDSERSSICSLAKHPGTCLGCYCSVPRGQIESSNYCAGFGHCLQALSFAILVPTCRVCFSFFLCRPSRDQPPCDITQYCGMPLVIAFPAPSGLLPWQGLWGRAWVMELCCNNFT